MSQYYASEKCFRTYENVIAKALEEYPNSVRFKSPTRNCITDSARCQNAITSYRRNQWASKHTVFAYFEERPISVWIEGSHCVVGKARNQGEIEIIEGVGAGVHGSVKVNPVDPKDVRSLIHMVNGGVIVDPIELPISWADFVNRECEGLLNIAVRVETASIIIF